VAKLYHLATNFRYTCDYRFESIPQNDFFGCILGHDEKTYRGRGDGAAQPPKVSAWGGGPKVHDTLPERINCEEHIPESSSAPRLRYYHGRRWVLSMPLSSPTVLVFREGDS